MNWRATWRATVENFVRELHGGVVRPAGVRGAAIGPGDTLTDAIAAARAEAAALERELRRTRRRHAEEESAAGECRRRRELAERIEDADTADIAGRFEKRHAERAAVLRRKLDVLRDERALVRRDLDELLEAVRADTGAEPDDA